MNEKTVKEVVDNQQYLEQQRKLFACDDSNFNEIIKNIKRLKRKYKDSQVKISNSYSLINSIIDMCTFHNFTIKKAVKELDSMLEKMQEDYIKISKNKT